MALFQHLPGRTEENKKSLRTAEVWPEYEEWNLPKLIHRGHTESYNYHIRVETRTVRHQECQPSGRINHEQIGAVPQVEDQIGLDWGIVGHAPLQCSHCQNQKARMARHTDSCWDVSYLTDNIIMQYAKWKRPQHSTQHEQSMVHIIRQHFSWSRNFLF
jgi:hypothetical protein